MLPPKKFEIECLGYKIAADLYEGVGDYVMLNLIGYKSNIDKYQEILSRVSEATKATIITVDYSGHGRSPYDLEETRPAQHFLEVIESFDWLKENYKEKKIIVMGASYGGFLATQLTKYREFDKLILRVPAIFKPENFYTKWVNHNNLDSNNYRTNATNLSEHPLLKRASEFKGRTLVITHELDDVCPANTTDAFIKALSAQHWEAKGFKHGFGESELNQDQKDEYYQKIIDWINQ